MLQLSMKNGFINRENRWYMGEKEFKSKSTMTRLEMAYLLGVSKSTLYRTIRRAGLPISSGLLTADEQRSIWSLFDKNNGEPFTVESEKYES